MLIDLPDHELAMFNILFNAGVFTIANGSAELHFNSNGDLAAIDIHKKVFRKGETVVLIKNVV